MPCLEVMLPVVDDRTKEVLSSALTKAFVTSTQFDADIFGIHYCEYTSGAAAIGGRVWHEGGGRYGDLQGILGTSLQAIPALTDGDEDAPEAAHAARGTSVKPEVVEDEDVESDDTSPTLAAA